MFVAEFAWEIIWDHSGELGRGLLITLEVTAAGFGLAAALGLPIALMRTARTPLLTVPAVMWLALARGIPLLIVIFLLYYSLAEQGVVTFSAFQAGFLSLGLTGSAYMAEIYRSALQAVPQGQSEAGSAIGLTGAQGFAHVLLPQALRTAVPPSVNIFVALLKGATLLSVIAMADMFHVAQVVSAEQYRPFELYTAAAVIIIAVTLVASAVGSIVERRLSRGYR
ncbi:MAG: amino acid ABC transporter permease [Actinobacteria bacterium]|nr:amino acid ABC transporter permease [Actinomycetota bacterium]